MEMMKKSQVMGWLINNDHKGLAITMSDFAHGSHTINVNIVKLVIGNDLFESLSKSVSIIDNFNKTPLQDLIDQLTIYKDKFDGDPIVNRYIGIAINEAKARLIDEKDYLKISSDSGDIKKITDLFYTKNQMAAITTKFCEYAFDKNINYHNEHQLRIIVDKWFEENVK